jgi:NAD(P)-dependent dehydrogenase (short-subunit alcohol dehydrogenase family)
VAKESKDNGVAVILGVGPGLVASLARRFAKGYSVAINARNEKYLHLLAEEIAAAGGKVIEVPADLGDRAQIAAAFKAIREKLGAPDVLLYNAGGGKWGNINEVTPEQYEDAWRVGAYGAFVSCQGSRTGHG